MTDTITTDVTSDEATRLRDAIETCDPAPLLMSLVHVTGDLGLLDEFGARLEITEPGNHYAKGITPTSPPGTFPADVVADIRARAAAILTTESVAALGVPDDALFERMATVATSERVDPEFVPLLLEQAGFVASRRVVPVTVSPPADFDVIVIGAGIVGINAAIKLGDAGFDYTVFEADDEIGGTWWRNTYPGAAVDTPSHYYSYSFELNPDWSKYYPTGTEYQEYLLRVVDKYRLRDNIRFRTRVLSATWNVASRQWDVLTQNADGQTEKHHARAVITALGMLNEANIPDVPGLDSFAGTMVHTASWDADLDLTGKRVVVLGTGCTSVQVVAGIVDKVESLDVVVRSPHWLVPEKAVVNNVPDGEKWALAHIPFYQEWFRLRSYWFASDNLYSLPRIEDDWAAEHFSASPANDMVLRNAQAYLQKSFPNRPDLIEKLTPTFRPYAKRIVKDPGFFRALTRDHVTLHRASFERVTPDGVYTTDGQFIAADVIILATGFQLQFTTTIDIVGSEGRTLAEVWKGGDDPRAYLGVQVSGFPNLFVTAGPNSAPNHGAGHNILSEEQVHYIVECLQYLLENDLDAMDVRQEVLDEYNEKVDAALDKTVWVHPGAQVNGYYRNSAGRAIVPCPWRLVDYWTMLRAPHPEDLVLTPAADNRQDSE
ncbi:FAD-dependent oxidoreductase [Gordonia pseudamarae]|mgnify:CR=1 FL=1|jgi:4-hydroxyacetophenone monooxygenase|uniref:FAD-dependent oxidoreductase n=1 Tax=Gordonia pseudamarae TaxID=2831662 RepID=A0ABX6INU9_9ACTN|nr:MULTISPECIES: NAD(P)/FAD-dependent oxidoreductase [Gordonia]MBD0022189.1 NAD(P)/FAD-dependent oxidoreductase [Gordonia sp. (in: high G+C Gram-positive bacteria)]QHN28204.1 FAD-dependent oxidoreductase [Gordonia pseudamarae]QHN37064.1 FAD-dependent oxidoreductase [Gordonia pseudamarae]